MNREKLNQHGDLIMSHIFGTRKFTIYCCNALIGSDIILPGTQATK